MAGPSIHNCGSSTLPNINSTITRNTNTTNTGGVVTANVPNMTNGVLLQESVVIGNEGGDLGSNVTLGDNNVIGGTPLLDTLQTDAPGTTPTIALLPGSPAIDIGPCPTGITSDQRGVPRPQGANCDAGAFESRGFAFTNPQGSMQGADVSAAYLAPLAVAVTSPPVNRLGEGK